jgi:hypothetical protein
VIATGTVLGGRYLIEGKRPGDHDGTPSWWALDRQLRRRVAVVMLPRGTGPLEMARTARLDYAGRVLDACEHEGASYLVIRAERGAPAGAPTTAGPAAPTVPVAQAPGDRGDTAADGPPVVHGDATDALPQPTADPTVVAPMPLAAAAAGAPVPRFPATRPGPRQPLSNPALMRFAALMAVAFVLGASGVLALAVLASPEPPPPASPANAAAGDARPTRTLPSEPSTSPTTELPPESVTTTTDPETTTKRSKKTAPPETTPETSTTESTRTTTTRRRRIPTTRFRLG